MQVVLVTRHNDNFWDNSILCPFNAKFLHQLLQIVCSCLTNRVHYNRKSELEVSQNTNDFISAHKTIFQKYKLLTDNSIVEFN